MPRRLQQSFKCSPLQELTRQLLFAPPAKRIEQVHRAERLHDEIDISTPYPIEYLIYRITGYRRSSGEVESVLLVGEAVQPDLRLIIDQLSRSVNLPEDDEPTETVDQVAHRLHVSPKTVNRWRKVGLRWRWVVPADGQPHIVIPQSALHQFMEQYPNRISRASRFTAVDIATRQHVLTRARQIVTQSEALPTLNRTADTLARETGRALETVRLILEKHDRTHPDRAIFTNHTGPLTPKQRRIIERAHRMGIATQRLVERFRRSRYTIHRVIREQRAAAAQQVNLDHVYWPTFDRDDAEQVIMRSLDQAEAAPADEPKRATTGDAPADDLPLPVAALYHQPTLSTAQQRSLFVRYNYLKYRAQQVRTRFKRDEPRVAELDRFDALLAEARQLRGQLVRANLRVMLSVARRHLIGDTHGRSSRLLALLEAGQQILFEAVESYNAAWSHSFESYLTNRLLTHYARSVDAVDDHGQARRRLSPERIRERLVAHARAHGVALIDAPTTDAAHLNRATDQRSAG